MPQVIVGLLSSYRDAHEALRALPLLGLGRDDGHLYRTGQRDADLRFAEGEASHKVEPPTPDSAEYVAHGEHQGVVGTTNRFRGVGIDSPMCADKDVDAASNDASARALLVVNAHHCPKTDHRVGSLVRAWRDGSKGPKRSLALLTLQDGLP